MKIGICIGHSRRAATSSGYDGGAVSVNNTSEKEYNTLLAKEIERILVENFIDCKVYDDYKYDTYSKAMDYIASKLKEDNVTLAMELHFNSSEGEAKGREMLYWHSSKEGKSVSSRILDEIGVLFPKSNNRGLKPVKSSGDRGGQFLVKTHCPSVIVEPFFGSSEEDWKMFYSKESIESLALAIAKGATGKDISASKDEQWKPGWYRVVDGVFQFKI
jgi:N-acetylmuramoyl-L-alanine amidase